MTSLTYPDGEVVSQSYDDLSGGSGEFFAAGTSGGEIVSSTSYQRPSGSPSSVTFGNGYVTTYTDDPLYRLGRIKTAIGSTTVQDLTYGYLANGNVQSISDTAVSPTETVTYSYDDRDRLTGASGFSGALTASYSYNQIGNLITKQEGSSSLTLSYPAAGQARPHAVTSTTGSLARSFVYDANGDLVGSGTGAHDFDAEGHLSAVLDAPAATPPLVGFRCVDQVFPFGGTITLADMSAILASGGKTRQSQGFDFQKDLNWSGAISLQDVSQELAANGQTNCVGQLDRYTYDGMGTMVKRAHYAAGATTPSSWTEYIGGIYEKNSDGSAVKYYSALGRTIAMRQVPSGGGSGTLSYLLADHLGSTVGLMDTSGNVVANSATKYWPYGATRSGAITQTDKQYTGQQIEPGDSALGLYNYKARFYSTALGRFVSADTVADGLNRYAYVRNNPLSSVDPSGHCGTGHANDSLLWNDCNNSRQCGSGDTGCLNLVAIRAGCQLNPWASMCGGSGTGSGEYGYGSCDADGQNGCAEDPACSGELGCPTGEADNSGDDAAGAMTVVVTVGLTAELVDPLPGDSVVVIGLGGAVLGCIQYCGDAGRAIGGTLSKGWNTFLRKKSQAGPEGIPGASRGAGGIIKLPGGTYLEKNTNQQGAKQSHSGERYEEQDPRNQRHRGVVVEGGKVIPIEDWKPGRVGSP